MRRTCVYWALAVSVLTFFLFVLAARRSFAAETRDATPGSLAAVDRTGKSLGACPLAHTAVKADIVGILSRVTVQQQFRNPYRDPIEAVYTFPLPHNAAVDDMTIRIGSRTIRGVIKSREEARAIYDRARAQGQQAALLDQERPNIFTQQLANILPGQDVDVIISFSETLKYSNGGYTFIFPMVVGPRYIPGQPVGREGGGWAHDTTRVPDASHITPPVIPPGFRSGHDVSVEVSIDSGIPFTNLRSIHHELAILRRDAHSALVRLAGRETLPNKDFLLSFDVAGTRLQDGLVAHKTGGDGYFMLILQPPANPSPQSIVPKELVFVLDTSGSMNGYPIEKAKEAMRMALDGLYSFDTFNLITFSGDTRILFPQPVPAIPSNLMMARQFIDGSYGSGGTEMMNAIRSALAPSDQSGRVRIVCFMTDGLVGNDMNIIAEVKRHPNARVFSFGIGSAPNRFLLDAIAQQGRGAAEYVTLQADASEAARRFHERVRNPLLTDISLDWSGLEVTDVFPSRIPDLFSAEPVVICGRYSRGGVAELRLRGRSGSDDFVRDIRIPLPDSAQQHEVLAKLWARSRIDALMAEDYAGLQRGVMRDGLREAITNLGLEYGLMTQFTSFVAVEEKIVNEAGAPRTVQVPVEMPEGMSYVGVFGGVDARYAAPARSPNVVGGIVGGVAGGILGGTPPPPPSPPQPRKVEPIRVGGNVSQSNLIYRVEPVYPELARRARVEATVMLEVTVDETGQVANVRAIRCHPLLCQAAFDAVKQWRYTPTLLNGNPVPVTLTVALPFRLNEASNQTQRESRTHGAIERVIARIKAGQAAGNEVFIRDGKADVDLLMKSRSDELIGRLRAIGFELISWPAGSNTATGRIPVEKLELLLKIEAVGFIAPHAGKGPSGAK